MAGKLQPCFWLLAPEGRAKTPCGLPPHPASPETEERGMTADSSHLQEVKSSPSAGFPWASMCCHGPRPDHTPLLSNRARVGKTVARAVSAPPSRPQLGLVQPRVGV